MDYWQCPLNKCVSSGIAIFRRLVTFFSEHDITFLIPKCVQFDALLCVYEYTEWHAGRLVLRLVHIPSALVSPIGNIGMRRRWLLVRPGEHWLADIEFEARHKTVDIRRVFERLNKSSKVVELGWTG